MQMLVLVVPAAAAHTTQQTDPVILAKAMQAVLVAVFVALQIQKAVAAAVLAVMVQMALVLQPEVATEVLR
jgi:hypothetical protein